MKINYSLIGLGGIAKIHLMALKNMPFLDLQKNNQINFTGLLTTNKKKNYNYAHSLGFKNIVESLDDLFKIPKLDMVDICTPNYLHKEQLLTSIKYNKNVYCEKPLALSSKEGKVILEALNNKNLYNQMGFVLRFLPTVLYTRSIIDNNLLGKIYAIRGEIYHSSYLKSNKKITWRLKKDKSGGGALADLGSHIIDLFHFLLGDIETVQAFTETIIKKRPTEDGDIKRVDVDDWALLMLKFKAGIKGTLEASRVAVGKEGTRVEIYGEKGSVIIDTKNPYYPKFIDKNSRVVYIDDMLLEKDEEISELFKMYPNPKLSQGFMVDAHTASLACFISSIINNRKNAYLPDFKEGYKAQKVIDYAYISSTNGGIPIFIEY